MGEGNCIPGVSTKYKSYNGAINPVSKDINIVSASGKGNGVKIQETFSLRRTNSPGVIP